MTAQDLVHCASHAKMKLSKQIGHGMSVKYLTGSKQLVTLLNRMGYSSSYDEIEQAETSLANESFAKADVSAVIIPTLILVHSYRWQLITRTLMRKQLTAKT